MLALGEDWIHWATCGPDAPAGVRLLRDLLAQNFFTFSTVITPVNRYFCDEENPEGNTHHFQKVCQKNGLLHLITKEAQAPLTALRAGWSDVKKGAVVRPSDPHAPVQISRGH